MSADALIWLSYVAIALTLTYMVRRARREIPFSWLFLAFGTFIIACGFTHFMEIVVLWKPLYWLAGDVKLVTAMASVITAIALPSVVPQILAMVRSAHVSEDRRIRLVSANEDLQHLSANLLNARIGERRRIARELHDGIGQFQRSRCHSMSPSPKTRGSGRQSRPFAGLSAAPGAVYPGGSNHVSPAASSPLLEEMGLASAVQWYVEGFTERSSMEWISRCRANSVVSHSRSKWYYFA